MVTEMDSRGVAPNSRRVNLFFCLRLWQDCKPLSILFYIGQYRDFKGYRLAEILINSTGCGRDRCSLKRVCLLAALSQRGSDPCSQGYRLLVGWNIDR